MTPQQLVARYMISWDGAVAYYAHCLWLDLQAQKYRLTEVTHSGQRAMRASLYFKKPPGGLGLTIHGADELRFLTDVAFHLVQNHPGCDAHIESDQKAKPFLVLFLLADDDGSQ